MVQYLMYFAHFSKTLPCTMHPQQSNQGGLWERHVLGELEAVISRFKKVNKICRHFVYYYDERNLISNI